MTELSKRVNGLLPEVAILTVVLEFTARLNVSGEVNKNGGLGFPEIIRVVREREPTPFASTEATMTESPIDVSDSADCDATRNLPGDG